MMKNINFLSLCCFLFNF